jgi:Glyoxalase-like domain
MNPFLRGIFLTSEDPAKTAKFYRDIAKVELEQVGDATTHVYWKVDRRGMQLSIHDARQFAKFTHPPQPDSNLTHLYFKIENQNRFLAHLVSLGIEPYASDDVVITVEDPDGRKVMFGTA